MKIEKTYNSMSIIKGIGAIAVCSSHILDCFVWKNGNKPIIWESIFSEPILWYFLWSGGFQVSMFCLISGFFAWKKDIPDIKSLLITIIKRYINFATMIFCADLIMCILSWLGLLPAERAAGILLNSDMPYTQYVTFKELLLNSIRLDISFNGALWMMKPLFIGNCLIYFLRLLKKYIDKLVYLCLGIMLIGALFYETVVFMAIAGVALYEIFTLVPEISISGRKRCAILFCVIVSLYLAQNPFGIGGKMYAIYTAIICMMICIFMCFLADNIDMHNVIYRYLRNESIAVYCVHIPVIYSIGLFLYMSLYQNIRNINCLVIVCYVATLISALVIAVVYQNSVERFRNWVVSLVKI